MGITQQLLREMAGITMMIVVAVKLNWMAETLIFYFISWLNDLYFRLKSYYILTVE